MSKTVTIRVDEKHLSTDPADRLRTTAEHLQLHRVRHSRVSHRGTFRFDEEMDEILSVPELVSSCLVPEASADRGEREQDQVVE